MRIWVYEKTDHDHEQVHFATKSQCLREAKKFNVFEKNEAKKQKRDAQPIMEIRWVEIDMALWTVKELVAQLLNGGGYASSQGEEKI